MDYDLQYQDTHIDALLATANELKTAGYIYKGVATPSTNPGTPTERVAYLASEPGTYTNFGGIVITSGLYSLTFAGGTWTATQMQAGSDIEVVQTTGDSTTDVMSQKAVTDEIDNIGYNYEEMDLSTITIGNYRLTSTKKWTNNSAEKHYWIPCTAGDMFRITAGTGAFNYAFMKTHNNVANANANVCSIYTGNLPVCAVGQTITITAPSDATGLALNKIVNGGDTNILKIERVTTIKDDIAEIRDSIGNIDSQLRILGDIRQAPSLYTGRVNVTDGTISTETNYGHTGYLATNGGKQILVYAPTMHSSAYGLAFYARQDYATYISGVSFSDRGNTGDSTWKLIDVPIGATCFRFTTWLNTDSQYRLVVTNDYLMQLYQDSAANCLATQIFRMAKVVSPKQYIYAFGISQQIIIGNKAYVIYAANEHTVDGDAVGYPNVNCMSIVDLFDFSKEDVILTTGTKQYADGSSASNATIGYGTYCPTPNGDIANFGLMRFNNNNPYYCWSIFAVNEAVKNWTGCQLSYNNTIVDFSLNNYRQMLVDVGYMSTYLASNKDYVDNINIHYNKEEGIYYAVLCGAGATNSQNLPLVLMQSTDLATWSPKAYLGLTIDAGEIAAIYKDGIAYVVYRRMSAGMGYIVYDVNNSTILSSGNFPTSGQLLSKPDCFTFDNDVYMAINIDPSIFGNALNVVSYKHDARNQIAIYKIVDNTPILFRVVCNPTGLQYFSFMETPTEMVGTPPLPVYEHGAIYIAFSEDRRHLYRRQIAQVSFADVTALFADFGRIG